MSRKPGVQKSPRGSPRCWCPNQITLVYRAVSVSRFPPQAEVPSMGTTRALMPRARQDELVVEELPDEILVYDLKRHKSLCLNPTAALVWRRCDGRTSVAEVAALLEEQWAAPTDEAVVWMALDRLGRAHLLSKPVTLPADESQYSRREVLRKLRRVAGISLLLPVIESIVAPLAAAQASGVEGCSAINDCTPCGAPNYTRRCCNRQCVGPGRARGLCGCT